MELFHYLINILSAFYGRAHFLLLDLIYVLKFFRQFVII